MNKRADGSYLLGELNNLCGRVGALLPQEYQVAGNNTLSFGFLKKLADSGMVLVVRDEDWSQAIE